MSASIFNGRSIVEVSTLGTALRTVYNLVSPPQASGDGCPCSEVPSLALAGGTAVLESNSSILNSTIAFAVLGSGRGAVTSLPMSISCPTLDA